jgi:hypothetical protein
MKFQLLKATAFALLQAIAVHSQEEAAISQETIQGVAAGAAGVVVDRSRGRCDNALNCCLNECDDDNNGAADWRACRVDCERRFTRTAPNGMPNRTPRGRRPSISSSSSDDFEPRRNNNGRNRRSPNRRPTPSSFSDSRDNRRNNRSPAYCDDRRDYDCYPLDGRPPCCQFDGGRDCPTRRPSCVTSFDGDRQEKEDFQKERSMSVPGSKSKKEDKKTKKEKKAEEKSSDDGEEKKSKKERKAEEKAAGSKSSKPDTTVAPTDEAAVYTRERVMSVASKSKKEDKKTKKEKKAEEESSDDGEEKKSKKEKKAEKKAAGSKSSKPATTAVPYAIEAEYATE